jgi:hypothetical protein
MTAIEDPVFGRLHFDNGWTRDVTIPFLEREFKLVINNAERFPPDEEQRAFWQTFMARQEIFKTSVESALFKYYSSHLEAFKTRYEFSAQQEATRLPILHDSKQIWALLMPTRWNEASMDVGQNDETSCLSILFAPAWDEEHGLEISFYEDLIGIESSGTNWANQDHYDLEGNPVASDA